MYCRSRKKVLGLSLGSEKSGLRTDMSSASDGAASTSVARKTSREGGMGRGGRVVEMEPRRSSTLAMTSSRRVARVRGLRTVGMVEEGESDELV